MTLEAGWTEIGLREKSTRIPLLTVDLLPLLVSQATESEVRTAVLALGEESPEKRLQAAGFLRSCSLKHENVLRSALSLSRDPEVISRLQEILAGIPLWKLQAELLRGNPELLNELRKTLPEDSPDRERYEKLLNAAQKKILGY